MKIIESTKAESWTPTEFQAEYSFGVIESELAYKATHFLAILLCLCHQKNIQHSPQQFKFGWSLGTLRGTLPLNFFDVIKQNVRNHGFQYFLVEFMNNKMTDEVTLELIKEIESANDKTIEKNYKTAKYYISGNDSKISTQLNTLLEEKNTEFYPEGTELEKKKVLANSDMCLVLQYEGDRKLAIFGEVEGNHGLKIRNKAYWDSKPKLSVFSYGILRQDGTNAWIQTNDYDSYKKVHVSLEAQHYVARDFHSTLGDMSTLLNTGPQAYFQTTNRESDFVCQIIRDGWNKPIEVLIEDLKALANPERLINTTNTIVAPFIVNIQK